MEYKEPCQPKPQPGVQVSAVLHETVPAHSHQQAEAHAGCIQDPLGHHKAHREEEVGGRDEGQHKQGQTLHKHQQQSLSFVLLKIRLLSLLNMMIFAQLLGS